MYDYLRVFLLYTPSQYLSYWKIDALEIQVHHRDPGSAGIPNLRSKMSPMVTLSFIMINLAVIFCFVWVEPIHVNKVLFCYCCLLLFQTWGSLNQTHSIENKNGSVSILMKLLVTMGDQSELNFGFTVSWGSRWCIWFLRAMILWVGPTSGWCVISWYGNTLNESWIISGTTRQCRFI